MGIRLNVDVLGKLQAEMQEDLDGFRSELDKRPAAETLPGLFADLADESIATHAPAIQIHGPEAPRWEYFR